MSEHGPKLGAFPAGAAFLPALAGLWLAQGPIDAADGLVLLPSRRAAMALAGAFLARNGAKALLLPRLAATGGIDEAGLALAGGLMLPPVVGAMQRQAILSQLILRLRGANGAPVALPAAWALAADLGALLDEADTAEVDLATTLPGVVAAELAAHWQTTLQFLEILTRAWPEILAGLGRMSPAARQTKLLDAQAEAWRAAPPAHRIWLVASSGSPALHRLARTVATLPRGLVILHGYDFELSEAAWEALEDSHAQAGIAALLAAMGARRDEILRLPVPEPSVGAGRSRLLSRALLPAAELQEWQRPAALDLAGLSRLGAADEAQNALAIAMCLRDALELPGRTAALITPDRALALRVTSALRRFGVHADDSAGEPLEGTPPAVFLRLLARAVAAEFSPLPLLALLKHPLAAGGLPPETFRAQVRGLELRGLRGPRPGPGFDGLKFRLDEQGTRADREFLDRLEIMLRPMGLPVACQPAAGLRALIIAGEALATSAEMPGAARLWAGEAGEKLSALLLEALAALADLDDIASGDLGAVLDALLQGAVVRRPRTKDGHPRVAIWGLQEAALQHVDVAVLGGLVESMWPGGGEPGPWLSRPMRKAAGLPSPECEIGTAAHLFFTAAASSSTVVLAAPRRRGRAPAVPARWLTRLEAMLAGAGMALPAHPAAGWAAQLDAPLRRETRPKPRPCPPAAARPKEYSISDIATLLANPYAVYAGKILKIRQLGGLDEESDASLFGEIVHAGLAAFFDAPCDALGKDAAEGLKMALWQAMREHRPRAALEAWWAARLQRISGWVVEHERARAAEPGRPEALALECAARFELPGGFALTGRADRLERRAGGISVIDYKTGAPPTAKEVQAGSAPQLPLEAMLAENGAFGAAFQHQVTELGYWTLAGRFEAGGEQKLFAGEPARLRAVIDQAAAALPCLFDRFAQAQTPFLAVPHPLRADRYDVYGGVSRRAEWAGGEAGDDGD